MNETERAQFPNLAAALDHVGGPLRGDAYLRILLDAESDGFGVGLPDFDATLGTLLAVLRPGELDEQLRALFGAEADWDKAQSEILGLAYFNSRGALRRAGWPAQGYGGTPPFDGLVTVGGLDLPFDIKPAKGSALQWLRDILRPSAEVWAAGRWRFSIATESTGAMTRQIIAPHRRRLVADFERRLAAYTELPRENIELQAGETRIQVSLRPADEVTVSTVIAPAGDRPASIEPTLRDHIREKARLAEANNALGFFLIYIRPPSSGTSDINPQAFLEALQRLTPAAPDPTTSRWLASVMLDWTPAVEPRAHFFANPHAAWPAGLNAQQLRAFIQTPRRA